MKKHRPNNINYKFVSRSSQANTFIITPEIQKLSNRCFTILYDMLQLPVTYLHCEHDLSKDLRNVLVTCFCRCGNMFTKTYSNMLKSPSCNCTMYQYKKGSENYQYTGVGKLSGKKFAAIKMSSAVRKLDFTITQDYIYDVLLKQEFKCVYSGRTLDETNMSLDRINPKVGYVVDNIQWVHKDVNSMKWDLTHKQFLSWCKRIANPIKSNRNYAKVIVPKRYVWNRVLVGSLRKSYFTSIFSDAKERKIRFDITMSDMWDQFVKQGGKCAITGVRLNMNAVRQSASLDRIDSKKGYTIDNIQWVHKVINAKIKINFDEEYMIKTCKEVYENCKYK